MKGIWVKQYVQEELLGEESLGEKYMGEKYVQEELLGEESLGEKYMGEKYVQEEFLGEESLGEKYMGENSMGKSLWVQSHWGKIGLDGMLAFASPSQVMYCIALLYWMGWDGWYG